MDWNNALLQLLSQSYKNNFTIVIIDYSRKTGVIENKDGTPTRIYYDEEKKEWV